MSDHKATRSVVASVVGGSGGKRGRCFASVAGPQADNTRAPAIALGTARSSIHELRAPMNRQLPAHATGKRTGGFMLPNQRDPESVRGFTLAELVVSVGVLVLLVLLFTQLFNSATTVTVLGYNKMDADSQARQVFDRMAFDFAQMVKRSDADYYLKCSWFASGTPPAPPGKIVRTLLQPGNDTIAFYSTVPGYYPSTGSQSPMSLVAYRVNNPSPSPSPWPNWNKLERMAKGLIWNGSMFTPTPTGTPPVPVVFMPIPMASPIPAGELPAPTPVATPTPAWPEVGSNIATWSGSEVIGPQVFRFEYYYILTAGTPPYNGNLSDTPWNTAWHTGVYGMQDIAAIVVDIAVIDPRSKVLVSDTQLARLNGADGGAPVLIDWGDTSSSYCSPSCPSQQQWQTTPGLLQAQWRAALDANTIGLPPSVISGIRVYERYFYLTH